MTTTLLPAPPADLEETLAVVRELHPSATFLFDRPIREGGTGQVIGIRAGSPLMD